MVATSRQPTQAHQPQYDGVVSIIIHFPQPAKAQKQVHDQQQHHQMPAKDGRERQVRKTGSQASLQLDALKELLEDEQS